MPFSKNNPVYHYGERQQSSPPYYEPGLDQREEHEQQWDRGKNSVGYEYEDDVSFSQIITLPN